MSLQEGEHGGFVRLLAVVAYLVFRDALEVSALDVEGLGVGVVADEFEPTAAIRPSLTARSPW